MYSRSQITIHFLHHLICIEFFRLEIHIFGALQGMPGFVCFTMYSNYFDILFLLSFQKSILNRLLPI